MGLKRTYIDTAIDDLLVDKADVTHNHSASQIVSGILDIARIGSGTKTTSTFLRGDNTFVELPTLSEILPTPKAFGAVGDGVTNDWQAVNDWWLAGGGWVDDDYFVSTNLPTSPNAIMFSNRRGRIWGSHQYHLVPVASGNVFDGVILEMTHTDSMLFALNPNAQKVLIQRCILRGSETNAVVLDALGIAHIQILSNMFDSCGYGVLSNTNAEDIFDVIVNGNLFLNMSKSCVEFNHPGTAGVGLDRAIVTVNFFNAPRNTTAPGAVLQNSGFGLSVAGATDVTEGHNVYYECRNQGLHIEDQATRLTSSASVFRRITGATLGAGPNNGLQDAVHILDGDQITIADHVITGCEDVGVNSTYDPTNALQPNSRGRLLVVKGVQTNDCTRGFVFGGNFPNGDVVVQGNISKDDFAASFRFDNVHGRIKFKDNIGKGSQYGLDLIGGSRPLFAMADNTLEGSIQDIRYDVPGIGLRVPDWEKYSEQVVATGFTPYVITMPLGVYCKGTVLVTLDAGADESEELYEITWDGTTFSGTTPVHTRVVNGLNPEIRKNGANLEVRAAYGTNGATVAIAARFDGIMIYRG